MIIESDGVPALIQSLKYNYSNMWFEALFFNNCIQLFEPRQVCPSVGLRTKKPNKMQMLEAENNINKLAEQFWPIWFTEDGYK